MDGQVLLAWTKVTPVDPVHHQEYHTGQYVVLKDTNKYCSIYWTTVTPEGTAYPQWNSTVHGTGESLDTGMYQRQHHTVYGTMV